jgi:5-methylcytosine-specific restriction endonuclease McrA
MAYSGERLNQIFKKTDGNCHLCGKRLCRKNYGHVSSRGAWEVDHSVPQARGGTHHGNNLYAACINCNRSKQDRNSRAVRAANGRHRAPRSAKQKQAARSRNTWGFGGMGALFGAAVAGPAGAVLIGLAGVLVGSEIDPEEK